MADFDIDVGANTSSAQQGFQQLGSAIALTKQQVASLDSSLKRVKNTREGTAAGQQRTLDSYQKLLGVTKQYRAIQDSQSKNNSKTAASTSQLTQMLERLKKAYVGVDATSTKAYGGQRRTLDLYSRMISLSKQAAEVKLIEARATKELAAAQGKQATAAATTAKANSNVQAQTAMTSMRQQKEQRTSTKAVADNKTAIDQKNAAQRQAIAANRNMASSEGDVQKNLQGSRYALYQVSAAYAAVSAATLGMAVSAVKTGADFEQAFKQVERVTSSTRSEIGFLYDGLIELSKAIPVGFEDLSEIAKLGGQMGIASTDLDSFTETVARFVATTDVGINDAATAFGRLSNLLHVPTDQFNNLGAAVSHLGTVTVATDSEITKVATDIAAVANSAGLSTEATIGLAASFASLAVRPQRARSAIQRLFRNVNKDISESTDKLDSWSHYMGISADELANLVNTDADKFMVDFLKATKEADDGAQGLTKMFGELGINSVRDVDAFTRLSGSLNLVESSIMDARIEFAKGTYLFTSSEPMFDSVTNKVATLGNAYKAFMDSVGQSSAIQETVKSALDVLTGFINALDKIPSSVKVGIAVFSTFIGLFAAYKSAIALAMAGTLAFQYVAQNGFKASSISARGLITQLNVTRKQMRDNAAVSTATSATIVADTNAATAAQLRFVGAVEGGVYALKSRALVSGGAAGVAGAGAAGAGVGAASKIGKFAKSLPGIGLAAAVVVSGLAAVYQAVKGTGDVAEQATAQMTELGSAVLSAGGGAQSLADAAKADAAALGEITDAGAQAEGVYATLTQRWEETADGGAALVRIMEYATGSHEELGRETLTASQAALYFKTSQEEVGASIVEANKLLEDQGIVLGENAQRWKQNAITKAILDDPDALLGSEDRAKLEALGVNMSEVIAAGIRGGEPEIRASLSEAFGAVQREYLPQIAAALRDAAEARKKMDRLISEGGSDNAIALATENYREAKNAIEDLTAGYEGAQGPMITLIANLVGANTELGRHILNAKDVAGALDILDEGMEDTGDAADEMADRIKESSEAFDSLMDSMVETTNLGLGVADAMDALGVSIAENGTDFSNYTEAGRKNLKSLIGAVDAYGAVLSSQIQSGQIDAVQAADQMQQYMVGLIQDLANIGVPTDQIDFLVGTLNNVVQHPWQVNVGADVSGAMQGINAVSAALQRLSQQSIVTYQGNMSRLDTSTAAGVRAASRGKITTAGQAFPGLYSGGGGYSGPTSFNAGQADAGMSDVLNGAYKRKLEEVAEAHKKSGGAAKKAGGAARKGGRAAKRAADRTKQANNEAAKAAKEAGKAQKRAAEEAAEAIKKQNEYLKDTADFYKNIGTSMFSLATSEGKVFEALQKLGVSVVENGDTFNGFREKGRANLAALSDTFDAFGETLGDSVQSGALTGEQAMDRLQEFAGGVYQELIKLGVPAKQIKGYFSAMGMDMSGWDNAAAGVKKYSGFVTAAGRAAKTAAQKVAEANDKMKENSEALKDYVSRLNSELTDTYDKIFGLPDAVDATAKAFNSMKKAISDAADQVAGLRKENEQLNRTVGEQQVVANKARLEYNLSLKYGETDRAKDYKEQMEGAKQQISDAKEQIKTNEKYADSIEENTNKLEGNSSAAIDNRGALRSLQRTMLEQIGTYAAAGHSQQEVARYAEKLKDKFADQMRQLGYTSDEVKIYTGKFDEYIETIKRVPDTVQTKAEAHTKEAINALNAIPSKGEFNITPKVYKKWYTHVKNQLKKIPKKADYKVKAVAYDIAKTQKAINRIHGKTVPISPKLAGGGSGVSVPIRPYLTRKAADFTLRLNIKDTGGGHAAINIPGLNLNIGRGQLANKGGMISSGKVLRGFAGGGLLPGSSPSDPRVDNLLAKGPGGMFGIRSGEFIQRQEAVDHYGPKIMNAMNDMRIPKMRFMAGGGSVGGSIGGSGGAPVIVLAELSPTDRKYLQTIADKDVTVRIGDRDIAASATRGGVGNVKRGGA